MTHKKSKSVRWETDKNNTELQKIKSHNLEVSGNVQLLKKSKSIDNDSDESVVSVIGRGNTIEENKKSKEAVST